MNYKKISLLFLLVFSWANHTLAEDEDGPREASEFKKRLEQMKQASSVQSLPDEMGQFSKQFAGYVDYRANFCQSIPSSSSGVKDKQRCLKNLNQIQLEISEGLFELRKKYLGFLKKVQEQRLEKSQKKVMSDLSSAN